MTAEFDYIVVGAGSSGSALACRLSESGRYRVLLLEAGPKDTSFWLRLPLGYAKTFFDPRLNWMYWSEAAPSLKDRRLYYPRGKVLGGSSSINALVYARGQAEDYDAWAASGNPGWAWADILPIYRKMEDHDFGASDLHGAGGPLHVTDIARHGHPLCRAFFAAAESLGYPFRANLNAGTAEGIGYYQITTKAGRRHSAARAYLPSARDNLRIETGAAATRILFEGARATGIEYRQRGELRRAEAGREVLIAAGAIGSPHLLMLSGIGPEADLRRQGIAVRQDAPAVGNHLHDHSGFDIYYRSLVPSLNSELSSLWGQFRAGLDYLLRRRGLLAMSLNQAGGFIRTDPAKARPDLQLYFCPIAYEKPEAGSPRVVKADPQPAFSLSGSPSRPESRGRLELRSADPAQALAIHPNLLSAESDLRDAIAGFRCLRRLAAAPGLAQVIAEETKPGSAIASDDEIADYLRSTAYSIFHPVGTCRMGPDPKASVVDARLKVHGVAGLRVVDASIFPAITSANTNAPAIMVGEKGAAMILAEAQN